MMCCGCGCRWELCFLGLYGISSCAHVPATTAREKYRTVCGAGKEVLLLIGVPRDHINEIGHKRRNQAFDDGRIAANHVLFVHVGLIVLRHNCDVWNVIDYSFAEHYRTSLGGELIQTLYYMGTT